VHGTEALVFDFDGVLVESTDVKTQAFATIYREYGADIASKAVEYHLAYAGVSRLIKFRHLHKVLLGIILSDEETAELGERFSSLVTDAVIAAPWVAGAREFLESHYRLLPLFVVSGTPDEELKAIIARRGMQGYFQSVHGSPATKGEIISGILQRHQFEPRRVLMIGDSATDYQGALEAGVRFLALAPAGSKLFPDATSILPDLTRLKAFLSEGAS